MTPLEQRVQALEARESIKDLFTRFARAVDSYCDPEKLEPLFTEDAVFDVGSFGRMEGGGIAISRAMKENNYRGFHWTLHYLLSPTVQLDTGHESAEAFCYYWGVGRSHPDKGERSFWVGGSYTALIARVGADWKFRRLNLNLELLAPYEEGFHKRVENFSDV